MYFKTDKMLNALQKVLPSVLLSQKHELVVCRPAPFFCMITHVTMYLYAFLSSMNCDKHALTISWVHLLTVLDLYEAVPITFSIDFRNWIEIKLTER
jgi:hypothetical protein